MKHHPGSHSIPILNHPERPILLQSFEGFSSTSGIEFTGFGAGNLSG
ncbi:MAG: hypothetical protein IPM48_07510 [Saprospiraceae bacterium]|nr:hypothetical protein [Saprospiraceae bacterium]